MKTREELKDMVDRMIVPMIEGTVWIPWEALEDMALLTEVVKERVEQDKRLQRRMAEAGTIYDISVSWSGTCGARMPTVRVTYKVKPEYKDVDEDTFRKILEAWNTHRETFFSFDIDCVDLDMQKIVNSLAFHNIECTPIEIINHHGHVLVRCVRDLFGKEAKANREFYKKIYHDTYFGENGLINQLKSEE